MGRPLGTSLFLCFVGGCALINLSGFMGCAKPYADAGSERNADGESTVGCKSDVECAATSPSLPYCELTRHQCVACRTVSDCPVANQQCTLSGVCADKCTADGGTCPNAGEQCCNGVCIDFRSDISNCGGCSKTCKAVTGPPVCTEGACIPASCADVLLMNPTAKSGVYSINLGGADTTAAFSVYCDMTSAGGGWTLVGRERANTTGTFRFLNADTGNPTGIADGTDSGLLGRRFSGKYTHVGITWNETSYIRFTTPPGFDFFANTVALSTEVFEFSTSEGDLKSWVLSGGGAKLCIASRRADVRPGDTSWAIKPLNDDNTECGCNSPGWTARGAFYGGTPEPDQTACAGFGGGWAGARDNGVAKGGITPAYETLIWIK